MRYVHTCAVFGLSLAVASCTRERSIVYRQASPDASAELRLVTHSRFPLRGATATFEVVSQGGGRIARSWDASELYPCFVAAAWKPDSSAVVGMFRNCWGASEVVAFDTRQKRTLEATAFKGLLAAAIRQQYALRDSVLDPIAWAMETEEARAEFAQRVTPPAAPRH